MFCTSFKVHVRISTISRANDTMIITNNNATVNPGLFPQGRLSFIVSMTKKGLGMRDKNNIFSVGGGEGEKLAVSIKLELIRMLHLLFLLMIVYEICFIGV